MKINKEEIKFDEKYVSEENNTTTLYFIAPKSYLTQFIPNKTFDEAVSMEISVEMPISNMEASQASVAVSPTRKVEDVYEDYDWYDVDLPYEEIEELIKLAA